MKAREVAAVACGLLTAGAASPVHAQWSTDPSSHLLVGDAAGDQNQPKVRPTADGGCYVSYLSTQGTGWDTWLQKLDAAGVPQWAHNGVNVADTNYSSTEDYGVAVDADGNAMVAFRDDHTGITQIGLQKVAPDGSLPWGPYGVTISTSPGAPTTVNSPNVVVTSDGNYVVCYTRSATGAAAANRARYQKVDAAGNLLWGAEGITITPAVNGYTAAPMAASDGGGVIVTMFTAGSFTVSRRVHAQKLDSAGVAQWNGGTPKVIQTTSTLQVGNFPQVISDGNDGMLVAWYDTGAFQCHVQHLAPDGTELFAVDGAVADITAARQRTSPWVAYDSATDETYMFYATSNTTQTQFGLHAQLFDGAGVRQFTDNGLEIVGLAASQTSFPRATLTSGGAIGSWFQAQSATTGIVRACKVTSGGALEWTPSIVEVCTNDTTKTRLDAAVSTMGFTMLAFGNRDGTLPESTLNIAAARINADGTLGNQAGCGDADFDGDGDVGTDLDIEAFFACLGGDCCATCGSADFDGDGDTGTDLDIEAFFRVLGGGDC